MQIRFFRAKTEENYTKKEPQCQNYRVIIFDILLQSFDRCKEEKYRWAYHEKYTYN